MKLSDYVVNLLEKNTDALFMLSGGGIMHLVDSIGKSKELHVICCHHEQAAAIAAEGYARIKNKIGVCVVTTGPGGTNAITGVAGAWLDSIPILVVSGQVKTDNITPRRNGVPVVRAIGFQELNIIDLVKPITKYAATVEKKEDIRFHLEKAIFLATHGRPGPVWVEIPLDIQGDEVEPRKLKKFIPKTEVETKIPIKKIVHILKKAKRPMLLVGNGVRLAGAEDLLQKVLEKFKFNAATVIFTADDLITHDYPNYLGRQGMWGNEEANFAVDNCDVLLVLGDRLQLTQTSYDYKRFAAQAKKIMVDIDKEELRKKTLDIDVPVWTNVKDFLKVLYRQDFKLKPWKIETKKIKPSDYKPTGDYLNLYLFLEKLSKYSNKNLPVTTGDGMASLAPHQALKIEPGQRFLTNAGLGHMGSGLPLAIGACVANKKKPVVCMEGDGSIMLNIQELQTIIYNKLPIKIFIYNNDGYFSIRNTHKNYFNKIFAADKKNGVSFPNFENLSKGWGIKYIKIANDNDLKKISSVMNYKGPVICELILDPYQKLPPKWSAGELSEENE